MSAINRPSLKDDGTGLHSANLLRDDFWLNLKKHKTLHTGLGAIILSPPYSVKGRRAV